MAGGQHVWVQNKGFAIRSGSEWTSAYDPGWHQLNLPADGILPNRYVSSFAVDEKDAQHVFVSFSGCRGVWSFDLRRLGRGHRCDED